MILFIPEGFKKTLEDGTEEIFRSLPISDYNIRVIKYKKGNIYTLRNIGGECGELKSRPEGGFVVQDNRIDWMSKKGQELRADIERNYPNTKIMFHGS